MVAEVAEARAPYSPEATPSQPRSRADRAEAIIERNVVLATAAGLVPVPIIDLVAMEVIQVKMLDDLGKLYDLDFTDELGKKIAGSLLSTAWSVIAGAALGYSLIRVIPFMGPTVSAMAMAVLMGASTRALGRTFVMHFESGGSLLDFDPQKTRSYFRTELDRSRQVVAGMQPEVRKP